jgi:hypothetical protein
MTPRYEHREAVGDILGSGHGGFRLSHFIILLFAGPFALFQDRVENPGGSLYPVSCPHLGQYIKQDPQTGYCSGPQRLHGQTVFPSGSFLRFNISYASLSKYRTTTTVTVNTNSGNHNSSIVGIQ